MPKINFKAVRDNDGEWCVLRDDADLSDIDPARVVIWEFDNLPNSVLLSIQARDLINSMALSPGAFGQVNQEAYALCRAVAHCATYCKSWEQVVETDGNRATLEHNDVPKEAAQSIGLVQSLPEDVLMAYWRRSNRGGNIADAKKLKKEKGDESG